MEPVHYEEAKQSRITMADIISICLVCRTVFNGSLTLVEKMMKEVHTVRNIFL